MPRCRRVPTLDPARASRVSVSGLRLVCVGLVLVLGTGACFVADEEGDTIITLLLNTEDELQARWHYVYK